MIPKARPRCAPGLSLLSSSTCGEVMSEAKRLAAEKALEYVQRDMVIGVGTGSTVAYFIDGLAKLPFPIKAAVSSS